jgi:hypothetical protein
MFGCFERQADNIGLFGVAVKRQDITEEVMRRNQ